MNMNSINANSGSAIGSNYKQYASSRSIGYKGQIVEGLITKVSDRISIDFSGKEVTVSESAVRNAKEGELRQFEIKDISENSIVLKEVGRGINDSGLIKATSTYVDTNPTTLKEHLEKSLGEKEEIEATEQEAEEAKSKLDDVAGRLTAKDYDTLIKEGDILEAYDLVRLDKALERVKDQQSQKQENVEQEAKGLLEHKEEIKQVSNRNQADDFASKEIAKRLEEANLPVTEANITRIATAMELAGSLTNISDKEMSYLISNQLEPTIENLYKATFSSSYTMGTSFDHATIDEMKSQMEAIIKSAGLEPTNDNLTKAVWLLEHNIPLTKENLTSLNELHEMNAVLKGGAFVSKALERMIASVGKGIAPEKTNLLDSSKKVEEVLTILNQSSDETIQKALELDDVITVSSLKRANELLTNTKSQGNKEQSTADKSLEVTQVKNIENMGQDEIHLITARRQLEEIRLKMTVEAGQRLIDKGIHIDTDGISKIVEELREIEDTFYRNLLAETGVEDSTLNVELLKETSQKLNDLKVMPSYILGSTLANKRIVTIDTLQEVGHSLRTQLNKSMESYDSLMTEPRSDLGDSIQKAFTSIDTILQDMDLEVTKANQRAVKILGYNNMKITKESIQEVKAYDTQVNKLMNELHPAVVVNMIKEGVNPLDTSIYELNAQIDEMREKLGVSEEEKYSTYLYKLEREQGITEEERKAYIGIYRLLNNVKKTDGAAIGSVLNSKEDVTLNHLLTAVRTIKSKGLNVSVHDNFGALESISFSKENITSQLDTFFKKEQHTVESQELNNGQASTQLNQEEASPVITNSNTQDSRKEHIEYMNTLLQDIMDHITPGKLSSMNETNQSRDPNELLDYSLEKLSEELSTTKDNEVVEKEYLEDQVKTIRELSKNSEDAIRFLQSNHISTSVNHLIAAKEMLDPNDSLFTKIRRLVDTTKQNDGILSQVDSEFRNISNKIASDCSEVTRTMAGLVDSFIDDETIAEQYNNLGNQVSQILKHELGNQKITSKDIANLKSINRGIDLVKSLGRSRNYEVPLIIGDRITNVNLKLITGTQESGKVDMTIYSEKLGTVEASFQIKGEEIKGLILCNNRKGLDTIKNNQEDLENRLVDTNLSLKQIDYGSYKNEKESMGSMKTTDTIPEENVDTRSLYQVAKALLYHIKEIEAES